MSLHINIEHECQECGAFYIPYSENIPCPNCGFLDEKTYDLIPQIINSAIYQYKFFKQFEPYAWYIGSIGDHIFIWVVRSIDYHMEHPDKSKTFNENSREYYDSKNWRVEPYMKEHIYDISIKVYEELMSSGKYKNAQRTVKRWAEEKAAKEQDDRDSDNQFL